MQIYAIVEFADAASAERLLHSREALLLKDRRLTLKPRNIKSHHGDEALQGTNSNPRKQKSRVHRSEPPEQLSVFDSAVMAKVSAAKSVGSELLHYTTAHVLTPPLPLPVTLLLLSPTPLLLTLYPSTTFRLMSSST